MKQSRYFFLILLSLSSFRSLAQFGSDTILAKDNVMIPLPMVSINFGIGNLMSDVKLSNGISPFKQFGYQLTITQPVTKFLNASFELYGGTVYGEEQRDLTNLNFKTSLFSQRLSIEYNFHPLLKPNERGIQTIRPYLGFGVGLLSFRSKGDLKSSNGSAYNYWSNGSIYAESEGTVNVSEATALERDFVYETDLRDANLDGLRKYSQLTFSLPINAGIRFQITKNIGLNAAFAYALNFSDMIDNVSVAGTGNRLGKSGNDNHLFGSLGLTVYLGTTKPSAKPKKATPEEIAAEVKAKADEKRAEQKAAKEKALEASNLVAVNAEQKSETASSEGDDVTRNQVPGSTVNDPSGISKNELGAVNSTDEMAYEAVSSSNDTNKSTGRTDVEQNGSLGENSGTKNGPEVGITNTKDGVSKTRTSVSSETNSATSANSGNFPTNDPNVTRTEVNEAGAVEVGSSSATQNPNDTKGTGTQQNSSTAQSKESTELGKNNASEDSKNIGSESERGTSSIPNSQVGNSSNVTDDPTEKSTEKKDDQNESGSGSPAETSADGKPSKNSSESEDALIADGKESKATTSGKSTAASEVKPSNGKTNNERSSSTIEKIENSEPKKTGKFHWADLDGDGMISPTEVLHFIDLLFEGESERNVEDIQFLIDYYFDQE